VARIIALVPDLLFGSRVQAALAGAGHEVTLTGSEAEARTGAPGADLLVVDLAQPGTAGAELVAEMGAAGELRGLRTLGFYAHVDQATRTRAQQAGFDLVVPRSRMAREGAELVGRLAAGAPASG
jgi:CheY-like chemotaxis protein